MSHDDATPDFIGPDWLFDDGWSFRATPPDDLGELSKLESPHAWDRFLCVLTNAKRGDFGQVGALSPLLESALPHPLLLGTLHLAAAIGGPAQLRAVVNVLGTDAFTQAAAAIGLAGDLSVVDALLARRRVGDAEVREAMEGALSQLLEPEPDRFYETDLDDEAYDALVRQEVAALTAKHGAGFRIVLGAPLRTRTLVTKLRYLYDLGREERNEASAVVGSIAFHLETYTGLSSAGIVSVDVSGNDVVDRNRLERLIEAAESWDAKARPRSGRRMFFGHVVPDPA